MRSRVLTLSWFGCFVLRSLLLLSIVAIPDAALGQCVDWHDYLHLRGRYWQHGVSFDMDVEGTFLYSANANSGMYVFDISDPDRVLLADFESVTFAVGIEVDSGYAYVAKSVRSRYGILVFDVRNPYDVRQVGGFEVASQITTLSIEGHVLYVGYGGGIWIYDLFDPATPKLLGCVEVLAYQVTVSNGLAAAVSDNKVSLVDVSDPELPVILSTIALPCSRDAVMFDTNLLVVGLCQLTIVDISDPARPAIVSSSEAPEVEAFLAIAEDGVAYLGGRSLTTIDISNPASPMVLGRVATFRDVEGLAKVGNNLWVTENGPYFEVFDATNPTSPTSYESEPVTGEPTDVGVRGDHAYVTNSRSGVDVFELTAGAPILVNSVSLPNRPERIVVSGDAAYVSVFGSGLYVLDLATPGESTVAGIWLGAALDVAVSEDLAYVAGGEGGLLVMDVSDKTHPTLIGRAPVEHSSRNVDFCGQYAYVNDTDPNRLVVVDIGDPRHPQVTGSVETTSYFQVNAVTAGDGYVYLCSANTFDVIDVSDPYAPAVVRTIEVPEQPHDMFLDPPFAYVACKGAGVLVFDVASPLDPRVYGGIRTGKTAWGITADHERVYVADLRGLVTLPAQCSSPTSVEYVGASVPPSPATWLWAHSRGNGRFMFSIESPGGQILLDLFDVQGRMQRSWDIESARGDILELPWNGDTTAGTRAPSGIYFVRGRADRSEARMKINLVR